MIHPEASRTSHRPALRGHLDCAPRCRRSPCGLEAMHKSITANAEAAPELAVVSVDFKSAFIRIRSPSKAPPVRLRVGSVQRHRLLSSNRILPAEVSQQWSWSSHFRALTLFSSALRSVDPRTGPENVLLASKDVINYHLRRFDPVRNFLQNFFLPCTSVPCII